MELRPDPTAAPGARHVVIDGDDVVGTTETELVDDAVVTSIDVVDLASDAAAAELLACVLGALPADDTTTSVRLRCSDDLVRQAARRDGFTASLRGQLERTALRSGAARTDTESGDLATLAAAVDQLLPDAAVAPRGGLFRSFELRATSNTMTATVRLPRGTDLLAEPIAAAIDTMFAVKARFGRAASGITKISFDHGGDGLTSGNIAGIAEGASGSIALTPNFVASGLMIEQRARWRAEGRARVARADDRPCANVDAVVAHECWHYLDAEVRTSGRAYVEFNASLGKALGVDSLELALRGRERDAPADWAAAYARLVNDVSHYAGTNPREAAAEMFSLWWMGRRSSRIITRFGELVEQHFPA
ncbi:MAG: hypothetical protein ABWY80_04075 [Acidimicrobiia bacterium]